MTLLSPEVRIGARALCLIAWTALAACSSTMAPVSPLRPAGMAMDETQKIGLDHKHGANAAMVRAFYGVPILQKSLFWDGNGEVDDYGAGVAAFRFVSDGVMLGMGVNGSVWMEPGHDVYAAEWEGLLRYYPAAEGMFFVDLGGGWVQGTEAVPTGGTDWNMSFQLGPGYEIPVSKGASVLLGACYHHTSNALGPQNDRNPSQNEIRFWVGWAFNF